MTFPTTCTAPGSSVPRRSPHKGREPWAVTACTYLDRKWSHLARDGETFSCARRSDASTTPGRVTGATKRSPTGPGTNWAASWASRDSRSAPWSLAIDDALPQYRVHHLLRTAGVESALARLGGVAVAGAAYRGVGIPACIASGRSAAATLSLL